MSGISLEQTIQIFESANEATIGNRKVDERLEKCRQQLWGLIKDNAKNHLGDI